MFGSIFIILFLLMCIAIGLIFNNYKGFTPFKMGMKFAISHFIFIIYCTVLAFSSIPYLGGDAALILGPPFFLDFPASFMLILIGDYIITPKGSNALTNNFFLPSVVYLTFGTIQYFLIGALIGWIYKKIKIKHEYSIIKEK